MRAQYLNKLFDYLQKPRLICAFFLRKLRVLSFIPDEKFIVWNYKLMTGNTLDLKNVKTFREKIQWLKLYDRHAIYTTLVDKVEVKKYVEKLIGPDYIIPTLFVADRISDIDWTNLPDQFVVKTSSGGGSSGVVICTDKSKLDIKKTIKKLYKSSKIDIYKGFGEWPYKNVPSRFLIEKFMADSSQQSNDLKDYKIFCFNGNPTFIQVIQNRSSNETIDFFDTNWNLQEFIGLNPICKNSSIPPPKPLSLHTMLKIARNLSKGIPFVRVDLYDINGHVYFGELTFYPNSGYGAFNPSKYDRILGDLLTLN